MENRQLPDVSSVTFRRTREIFTKEILLRTETIILPVMMPIKIFQIEAKYLRKVLVFLVFITDNQV